MPLQNKVKELIYHRYGARNIPYSHSGEYVYCLKPNLKHFIQNKVYKIEKIEADWRVKIEGVKSMVKFYSNFDFVENNPAIWRDFQINQALDLTTVIGATEGRKIDNVPNKQLIIAQILLHSAADSAGEIGFIKKKTNTEILINNTVSCRKGKIYDITEEDFKELMDMPLKDIIELFNF